MLKPPLIRQIGLQLNMTSTKGLLLVCLLSCITDLSQASENTDFQFLLDQYQEPLKSELHQVARFVASQRPGKIIKIQSYSDNPEKYYRVKMINDAGYLKTFYIDQAINKVRP